MARRKRKAAKRRNPTRRRSRARARVRHRRPGMSVNPRRRKRSRSRARSRAVTHRRRRMHRNPGLSLGGIKSSAMTVGMGVAGGVAGLFVGNYLAVNVTPKLFTPNATDTATTVALKQMVVPGAAALAVVMLGRKYVPPIVAYGAAIGLLILPVRQLIYALMPPTAGAPFLGGGTMAMPMFPRAGRVTSSYPQLRSGMSAYPATHQLGAYPQIQAYPAAAYNHQPG
jgi:hypothetical protein